MKVVVQVPCLNEEETLPLVLGSIPKKIPHVDSIEILIIDDGSTDKTVEIAKKYGVKHFVFHRRNRGLARSFQDGVLKALEIGADIVVNTDGDNQYPQERIVDLVQPIIRGEAEIVIGDRGVDGIQHFSRSKKLLQKVGTRVLNMASGTKMPDAPSGFRAYSKEALMQINVVTRFSYAMETTIQAGNKGLAVATISIKTNAKTRESRLFKTQWEYVRKSGSAIIRAFVMYKPVGLFLTLGGLLLALGLIPFGRFLYFVIVDSGQGHIQSLIVGSVLLMAAFIAFTLGVIADLIRINRSLIEDSLEQIKRSRFDKS